MIGLLKTLNKYIDDLWHSKNSEFKNTFIGGVGILLGASLPLMIILLAGNSSEQTIYIFAKYLFGYLCFAFSYLALTLIITYVYVFGLFRKSCSYKLWGYLNKTIYKIILLLGIIVEIPLLLMLKLMEIMISYRAKKVDNIINLNSILLCNFVVIIFLYKVIEVLSYLLATKIYSIALAVDIYLNKDFIVALLFIVFIKLLMDLTSGMIFKLLKKKKIKEIKGNLQKIKVSFEKKMMCEDIKENFEKKNQLLKEKEIVENTRLEYDLNYHKKSIWRIQLILLIFSYIYIAVSKNEFGNIVSEIKDAITSITLFMLYYDKRKEWM